LVQNSNGMSLDAVEWWVGSAGIMAVLLTLGVVLWGMARGLRRTPGLTTGSPQRVLSGPFYVVFSVLYFGVCYALWRPVPLALSEEARTIALALGGLLFFPGLALVLWGRLALSSMYNVSSGFGVRLYADHRLVTEGPFAFVRHPMYLGVLLVALGGILIYRTWTFVFFLLNFPGIAYRARLEERTLALKFGEQWEAYRRQVPAWIPRLRRPKKPV